MLTVMPLLEMEGYEAIMEVTGVLRGMMRNVNLETPFDDDDLLISSWMIFVFRSILL